MQQLIPRPFLSERILRSLSEAPVTAILGARQTGKTTLAQVVARHYQEKLKENVHLFDLERQAGRASLSTPELTLEPLEGLIVIDEIQIMPHLFMTLRPLADRADNSTRFLILGSASPDLVKGVSESLAGRVLFERISGFTLDEVGEEKQQQLWVRGGFPRSFLAGSNAASMRWREAFIATFLERDLPQLGIQVPAESLRRFWTMMAHYHGQLWNGSQLGRSLGVSSKTALRYRDILSGGYVIRVLFPWFENLKKRQVKSPKVYIRDSGLLHNLLGIHNMQSLQSHPQYGPSFEGFALEQLISIIGQQNIYFWGTQRGAELDVLAFRNGKRWGFEFKCSDAPTRTKSMQVAIQDLGLEKLFVIYPGKDAYPLDKRIEVIPLVNLINKSSSPQCDFTYD